MSIESHDFRFRSVWRVPGELVDIWNTVGKVSEYPTWWPGIKKVDVLKGPELPISIGTHARYTVESPFYSLSYETLVQEFDTGKFIVASAHGDLTGTGIWTFRSLPDGTEAVFDWHVKVGPPVLRLLSHVAPVRAVMKYFHNQLMDAGEVGLRRLIAESTTQQKLPA